MELGRSSGFKSAPQLLTDSILSENGAVTLKNATSCSEFI